VVWHKGILHGEWRGRSSFTLGVVSSFRIHRAQAGDGQSAVVRFCNKQGTAEQRVKEGRLAVKVARLAKLPSFPSNEALQPGEPVATAGAA
jgi:hypothetical protein